MADKKLIMTVGLPRSGKSTWARSLDVPIVNPDAIRLALHGQAYRAESEPMVWAMAKCMVRALFLAGHRTVILDATNTQRARRDEWQDPEWEREFRVFLTPASQCVQRARDTDQEYLLPVIDKMQREYEPVQPDEGTVLVYRKTLTCPECDSQLYDDAG